MGGPFAAASWLSYRLLNISFSASALGMGIDADGEGPRNSGGGAEYINGEISDAAARAALSCASYARRMSSFSERYVGCEWEDDEPPPNGSGEPLPFPFPLPLPLLVAPGGGREYNVSYAETGAGGDWGTRPYSAPCVRSAAAFASSYRLLNAAFSSSADGKCDPEELLFPPAAAAAEGGGDEPFPMVAIAWEYIAAPALTDPWWLCEPAAEAAAEDDPFALRNELEGEMSKPCVRLTASCAELNNLSFSSSAVGQAVDVAFLD